MMQVYIPPKNAEKRVQTLSFAEAMITPRAILLREELLYDEQ